MTDFDSNPFADPEANSPFADSTTQPSSGSSAAQGGLDDYNPFAQKQTTTPTPAVAVPPPPQAQVPHNPQPAVISPEQAPPPAYTPSAQQNIDTAELQRRQEELERKAAELQERESRLRERAVAGARDNNWPPLPNGCCFGPCFYQDIDLEIPPEFKRTCKAAYYMWIAHAVVYALNMIFAIGYVTTAPAELSKDAGVTMGLSMLWVLLFIPASFICWYRPVYKALRSDSSINYFFFFFVSAANLICDAVAILGVQGSGYLGILSATAMVQVANKPAANNVGIIMFIMMAIFIPLSIADFVLLIKVHSFYRGSGASFSKAQSELSGNVLRNEQVQQAGASMAANAAAGAFSGAASNANRY